MNEELGLWQMLLWLAKNKIHCGSSDNKNVFVVEEHKALDALTKRVKAPKEK
jgi:hypothetical protein